jgi:hypothetical protein
MKVKSRGRLKQYSDRQCAPVMAFVGCDGLSTWLDLIDARAAPNDAQPRAGHHLNGNLGVDCAGANIDARPFSQSLSLNLISAQRVARSEIKNCDIHQDDTCDANSENIKDLLIGRSPSRIILKNIDRHLRVPVQGLHVTCICWIESGHWVALLPCCSLLRD